MLETYACLEVLRNTQVGSSYTVMHFSTAFQVNRVLSWAALVKSAQPVMLLRETWSENLGPKHLLLVNQMARKRAFWVSCAFCPLNELEVASAYIFLIFR